MVDRSERERAIHFLRLAEEHISRAKRSIREGGHPIYAIEKIQSAEAALHVAARKLNERE